MDIFGFNRFFSAPERERPPKKGPARFFQVFWDNLGGLLGSNLLTCAGFLPLALGVSLGAVFENFWLTLLAGAAGGALAGLFWSPMLSLALQAFRGGTRGWFSRWRRAFVLAPAASAELGAFLGLLGSGFLLAGTLMGQTTADAKVPMVSMVLALDFFLLSLLTALCFPVLCACGTERAQAIRALLFTSPLRVLGSAVGVLLWCALMVALFPVSVPFALVLGFWPPALLTAQLLLPPLSEAADLSACDWSEPETQPRLPAKDGLTAAQRGEIWWRRRGPVVVTLTALVVLAAWGGSQLLAVREPDLQIAVVHRTALPDSVRTALEHSLAARVGDRNGDGTVRVLVNDYTVVFDGSATDSDLQTAGSALLVSDLATGESAIYLAEDPEGFLSRYADQVDGNSPVRWADCPVLASLDAGTYSDLEDISTDRAGQSLLAELTVLPGNSAPAELLELLLG